MSGFGRCGASGGGKQAVAGRVCPQGSTAGTGLPQPRSRGARRDRVVPRWPDVGRCTAAGAAPAEFTTGQARGAGLSDKVLARLVRAGRVTPVRRGLFRLPPPPAADRRAAHVGRIRAVAAAFADDHAVSHLSAAALLGLPMPLGPPGPVHLTRLRALSPLASGTRRRRDPPRRLQRDAGRRAPRRTGDGGGATAADCLRTLPLTASVPARRRGAAPRVDHRAAGRGPARDPAPLDRCATARLALAMTDGRRETWLESYSFVRLDRLGIPGWRRPGDQCWTPRVSCWAASTGSGRTAPSSPRSTGHGKYLDGALGPTPEHAARAVVAEKAARGRHPRPRPGDGALRTSTSCCNDRCSWPPGSSARGPAAVGPASAAASCT